MEPGRRPGAWMPRCVGGGCRMSPDDALVSRTSDAGRPYARRRAPYRPWRRRERQSPASPHHVHPVEGSSPTPPPHPSRFQAGAAAWVRSSWFPAGCAQHLHRAAFHGGLEDLTGEAAVLVAQAAALGADSQRAARLLAAEQRRHGPTHRMGAARPVSARTTGPKGLLPAKAASNAPAGTAEWWPSCAGVHPA